MNAVMKVFLMIFVVAVLTACSEAQSNNYNGPARGRFGRYGGYGGANQGGGLSQGNDQDAYNVNYGSGDLSNSQRNQGSQQGNQQNRNGRGGYYYY